MPRGPAVIPPETVQAAAEARGAARAARDWAAADRLRGEIEAAGWKVVDSGVAYRLEPAHPPDIVDADRTRYGRSDAVPSRLAEPATSLATVIVVVRRDPGGAERAARSALATAPRTGSKAVDLVVVLDGRDDATAERFGALATADERVEIVRTSATLGQGAALNIGARRARGEVLVVVDAKVEATGDLISPLVDTLADPQVGVCGPFGLVSADLRHVDEVLDGAAAAIGGDVMAFRRSDVVVRGPFDEAFRFERGLDIWWSLVLRDEGPGRPPRTARVVAGLPLLRHDERASSARPASERERLARRNLYRVLDRFRDRMDLAVPRS